MAQKVQRIQKQKQHLESDETSTCWSCFFQCLNKPKPKQGQVQGSMVSTDKLSLAQCSYSRCEIQKEVLQIQDIQEEDLRRKSTGQKTNKNYLQRRHVEIPKNKIFFLKSKYPKNSILAKLTEKQFKLNTNEQLCQVDLSKQSLTQTIQAVEVFKLFDQGIESTSDSWKQTTPETIAKYIANRTQGASMIIDLGCGIGGNTIQFAKQCDFVIGVEINEENLKHAKSNADRYRVEEKIDFIFGNLLNLKHLKADIVFANPSIKDQEKTDLFRDCSPNIFAIMEKSLHIAPNVILQLPRNIDITQLPALFDFSRDIYLKENYPHSYAIEIEQIYVNKKLEYNIVYFGNVANIKDDEINHFLVKQLIVDGSQFNGIELSETLPEIIRIAQLNIGIVCPNKHNIEKEELKESNSSENPLTRVMEQFLERKLFTINDIRSFERDKHMYPSPDDDQKQKSQLLSNMSNSDDLPRQEQRLNQALTRSIEKKHKQTRTSPEDQIFDFSLSSEQLGSEPFTYSYGIKQELLENSDEDIEDIQVNFYDEQSSPKAENDL